MEHHSFVSDWLSPSSVVVDLGVNAGGFAMHMIKRRCAIFGVDPLVELTRELPTPGRWLSPTRSLVVERGAVAAKASTFEDLLDRWAPGRSIS